MNLETNNISGEKRKISDISTLQENNMSIPITLEKCVSLLDKRVLLEYLPKERIKALLKSDKLALEWGKSSYSQRYAEQNHLNEIKQLKAYLQKYNDKYSAVLCKYVKPKHGWGLNSLVSASPQPITIFTGVAIIPLESCFMTTGFGITAISSFN